MVFVLLPRSCPPVFLAGAGGSAFFFCDRSAAVKGPKGPKGLPLTASEGAVSLGAFPSRPKSSGFYQIGPQEGGRTPRKRRRGGGRGCAGRMDAPRT